MKAVLARLKGLKLRSDARDELDCFSVVIQ
jgi:hypothetical protein